MIKKQIIAEGFLSQLEGEVVPTYDSTGKTLDTVITELLAFQKHTNPITKGTIAPTWEDLSGWVSPTSFVDSGAEWDNEPNAYDDNESTSAVRLNTPTTTWTSFLELTFAAGIVCDKIRILPYTSGGSSAYRCDIDIEYGIGWQYLFDADVTTDPPAWKELDIGHTVTITAMRLRFYNDSGISARNFYVKEADFWGVEGGKLSVTNQSILWALLQLYDIVGEGYIYVDNDRKLQWPSDIGDDTGQQIRYRKNLQGITKEIDWGRLTTRLYPIGNDVALSDLTVVKEACTKDSDASYGYVTLTGQYTAYNDWTAAGDALPSHVLVYEDDVAVTADFVQGADERTVRCAIGDYNGAADYTVTYQRADYLMAWDDIATYGILTHSWTDKSIGTAGTLLTRGRLELTNAKTPPITYKIQAADLSIYDGFSFDALQLGSIVTVIDEELGIDVSVRVTRLTRPDLLAPQRMYLELSNKTKSLADSISDIHKQIT